MLRDFRKNPLGDYWRCVTRSTVFGWFGFAHNFIPNIRPVERHGIDAGGDIGNSISATPLVETRLACHWFPVLEFALVFPMLLSLRNVRLVDCMSIEAFSPYRARIVPVKRRSVAELYGARHVFLET